nr:LmbU family transcriptional regulator [Nocardiopsis ansamitocini]
MGDNGKFSFGDRGYSTRRTTLSIPDGMPLGVWERLGRHIFVISDASAWWLGDWLIYGQHHYPDRYKRAIGATSLDYQTLRNYAWIARKFTPSRRRENLSFQHHAEVAGLAELDQEKWLAEAEAGGWSRNELRRRIRGEAKGVRKSEELTYLQLSVPTDRKQKWQLAAEGAGMGLQEWVESNLDKAAVAALEGR